MKLLLVTVPIMDQFGGELYPIGMDQLRCSPPYGVYLLASQVRASGHSVEVLDLIARGTLERREIVSRARRNEIVGISTNSLNWPSARLVLETVHKEFPEMPIVLGGVHPSLFDSYILGKFPVNCICRGEGEVSLVPLLNHLSGRGGALAEIPSLSYVDRQGNIHRNPDSRMLTIDDLANGGLPAYDLVPDGIYEAISIESSRGCRFNCAFCSTVFRRSYRAFSPETFIDRVERILPYGPKSRHNCFSVIDDLFTHDRKRVIRITEILEERGLSIQTTLDVRADDLLYPGLAEALVPITNRALVGAECGYDEGLRKVKKGETTKTFRESARILKDLGISNRFVYSFIVGFPWESYSECAATLDFAAQLMANYGVNIYLQWYCQIPGSAIWKQFYQSGYVSLEDYDDFGFFRNKKLFWSAVRLSPKEITQLSDTVDAINKLFLVAKPSNDVIRYSIPDPVLQELNGANAIKPSMPVFSH